MNKINELERLQNLKASGALSEEEFEIEKAKILNDKPKHKKLNWWQTLLATIVSVIIGILLTYIILNVIVGISDKKRENIAKRAQKATDNYKNSSYYNNQSISQNTTSTDTSTKPSSSTSLIGNHNIVYYSGLDISDYRGYLNLKEDNTFKLYLGHKSIDLELIDIEGTYKILGNEITLNVTKEGGFDISSQSRKEVVTIEKDNLSYYSMKFAK